MLIINKGYDIFRTTGAAKDFSVNPIPGAFFNEGALPFAGRMLLSGRNLTEFRTSEGERFELPRATSDQPENAVDTIIWRKADIELPTVGSSATIEVQVVDLSMETGDNPVEILNGAWERSLWDVRIEATRNSAGSMTARREFPDGGHYDAVIPVQGTFTFVRRSDGTVRILDMAGMGIPPLKFTVRNVPWMTSPLDPAPSRNFLIQQVPRLTSNFVPGYHPLYGRVLVSGLELEPFGGGPIGDLAAYHDHVSTSTTPRKIFV